MRNEYIFSWLKTKAVASVILLSLATLVSTFTVEANRAYKSLSDTKLYERTEKPSIRTTPIGDIQRGDTVLATEETEAFLIENSDKSFTYLPVEYKGKKGWIQYTFYYPIKIEPTDTLHFVSSTSAEKRDPIERLLVPQIEWAMNVYNGPTGWLYGILISAGMLIGFLFLRTKIKTQLPYILMGLALVAMSACEIMYIFSFHGNILWFVFPSQVGGWGHAILNFFLFAIATAIQTFGLYSVWMCGLDSSPTDPPKWLQDIVFVPILTAIAMIIAVIVDKPTTPLSTYLLIMGSLALPALCGMGWLFMQKRFVEGCVYPVIYLLASVGLSFSLMVTGMLIILLIIVIIVAGIALSFAWGALSTVFGGKEVTVITNDGRSVKGTENWDGTVSGYDGKKYHVD